MPRANTWKNPKNLGLPSVPQKGNGRELFARLSIRTLLASNDGRGNPVPLVVANNPSDLYSQPICSLHNIRILCRSGVLSLHDKLRRVRHPRKSPRTPGLRRMKSRLIFGGNVVFLCEARAETRKILPKLVYSDLLSRNIGRLS
jgi:hypothetical protein